MAKEEIIKESKEEIVSDYFAAQDPDKLAAACLSKGESFFNNMRFNNYLEKLTRSWKFYHGYNPSGTNDGHEIEFTGEQGELVRLPVNHFRNIARHMHVIVTSNRPSMDARAVNTDAKSLAQAYLANSILEYYMREKRLGDIFERTAEMAIVLGSGFVKMAWNSTAGDIYDADPETGEVNYEGEIEFAVHSPFDVITDGTKESWSEHDWVIVRSFQNKYNLIAKYPELKDQLVSLETKNETSYYRTSLFSNDDTDDVPFYEFFHRRTEAMPEGRYLAFASPEAVMIDAKLPYRVIPVFRMAAGDIMGTPYGYTDMFDVMPIQEGINSAYSTVMTNQNAFGVQNVFVPRGADISVASLEGGMNIIEGNAEPKAVNLTQTPAEVFKFLETLIQSAETISGINSVARGNPEASLRSGTALALVQSTAIQFISGLQRNYIRLIEDVGTALIQILKDFATTPKTVALAGKSKRWELKQFTGEDISSINRVIVDVGNPLAKSIAGRAEMASQMLQMQLIKTPQQYFEVINTGSIDVMYESDMQELLLIRSENEKLMDGQDVMATAIDQHSIHIKEHKSVLSDPDLRSDPTLVAKVLNHIQQHIDLLRNTDPALLQLINEQPLPPNPAATPVKQTEESLSMTGIKANTTPQMMAPPTQPVQPGQQIQGPGTELGINVPNLPQVPQEALINPELQQSMMGNVAAPPVPQQ